MLVHTYSLQLLSAKLVYFTDTTADIRVVQRHFEVYFSPKPLSLSDMLVYCNDHGITLC